MSGPWTTPPAGADLPPRNGNVQMYHTRQIYPRNDVTGGSWTPGRELVFQFESDPASGWLVPDQCKLYARFSIGTMWIDALDAQLMESEETEAGRTQHRAVFVNPEIVFYCIVIP